MILKHTVFITLFFLTMSFGQKKHKVIHNIYELGTEDVCLITRSDHISWIDWSADDKRVFFITPSSGTINLFEIKLNQLDLTEIQSNFYVANYLLDPTISSPIKQITFERDREVHSPICLPNSNMVAYRTNFKYSPDNFFDHDIRVYDFENQKTKIIYKGEVALYDFIDNQNMLFVSKDDRSTIKKLDTKTGKVTLFITLEFPIQAMQFKRGTLLVKSENNVYVLNTEDQSLRNIYNRKLFATRMFLINNKLFTTFPGPASGMIDLDTNEKTLFFNAQDFEPTLSNNKDFISAISQRSLGIMIKRIDFSVSEFY